MAAWAHRRERLDRVVAPEHLLRRVGQLASEGVDSGVCRPPEEPEHLSSPRTTRVRPVWRHVGAAGRLHPQHTSRDGPSGALRTI